MGDSPPPKDAGYYAALQRLQLEQWARDQNEGITLRNVQTALKEHIVEDKGFHGDMSERVAKLEAGEERDAEDRQFANEAGTGRYHVQQGRLYVPPVPPATPPVAISVSASTGESRSSRRPAKDSVLSAGLREKLVFVLAAFLLAAFGYLTRHLQALTEGPREVPAPVALPPAK